MARNNEWSCLRVLHEDTSFGCEVACQAEVLSVLALASERLHITDAVESFALQMEQQGLGAMDAIHLALASAAKADFFCTCDDRLLRKAQAIQGLFCKVTTLLGLVPEVTK